MSTYLTNCCTDVFPKELIRFLLDPFHHIITANLSMVENSKPTDISYSADIACSLVLKGLLGNLSQF